MRQPNDATKGRRPRIGSLFSGYGGLDLAVEEVFDAKTVWVSEFNPAVARVFTPPLAERVPNLGNITTINWQSVEAGRCDLRWVPLPGRGCSTSIAVAMRAYSPERVPGRRPAMRPTVDTERVVAENVRGLLSATATRPTPAGDNTDGSNPEPATSESATGGAVRGVEPDRWRLADQSARPLRALGAVLGDLADLGYDAR